MRKFIVFIIMLGYQISWSQTRLGNSFKGESNSSAALCTQSMGAFSDDQVNRLIDDILGLSNLKNRFIVVPCAGIPNCQAIYFEGKPYILYNATFLEEVKRLSFSEKEIVTSDKNWEVLTILAHEIGHHFNNHLNNPPPGSTRPSLELEADEYAGFVIYMLGGSLTQAQRAYQSLAENPTYEHPGRKDRLDAISKGWKNGELRNSKGRSVIPNKGPVTPKNNSVSFKSVIIGEQVWMAENLNVDRFRNGDPIPEIRDAKKWKEACDKKQPAWCYYENDLINGFKYGKLYNWYAVIDPRGLAPEGWRVPTNDDWNKLINELGGKYVAGDKMKSDFGWEPFDNKNEKSSNSSGFSGLPGGHRTINPSNNKMIFELSGKMSWWWSSGEKIPGDIKPSISYRVLYYRSLFIPKLTSTFSKVDDWGGFSQDIHTSAYSVRCLKN